MSKLIINSLDKLLNRDGKWLVDCKTNTFWSIVSHFGRDLSYKNIKREFLKAPNDVLLADVNWLNGHGLLTNRQFKRLLTKYERKFG